MTWGRIYVGRFGLSLNEGYWPNLTLSLNTPWPSMLYLAWRGPRYGYRVVIRRRGAEFDRFRL